VLGIGRPWKKERWVVKLFCEKIEICTEKMQCVVLSTWNVYLSPIFTSWFAIQTNWILNFSSCTVVIHGKLESSVVYWFRVSEGRVLLFENWPDLVRTVTLRWMVLSCFGIVHVFNRRTRHGRRVSGKMYRNWRESDTNMVIFQF